MPSCKIIIKDEVNVKIENLDLDTRKALVKKFKYEDPTARFRPAYKLGRWDGSISVFGLGGTTYLSMLPKVLEYLELKNYHIELEDQRNPLALEFSKIGMKIYDLINEEDKDDKPILPEEEAQTDTKWMLPNRIGYGENIFKNFRSIIILSS